jgi:hypothetical protein
MWLKNPPGRNTSASLYKPKEYTETRKPLKS